MNKDRIIKLCKEYMIDRMEIGYREEGSRCINNFNLLKDMCKDDESCKLFIISVFYNMWEISVDEINDVNKDNLVDVCYCREDFINLYVYKYQYDLELSKELLEEELNKFDRELFGFDISG